MSERLLIEGSYFKVPHKTGTVMFLEILFVF